MAKKEKEFTAKGWKSNKILSKLIEDAPSHKEIAEYIKSPAFTEKDYIDVMSGMYKDLNPHESWGYGGRREVLDALNKSPHNKTATNDKAVDFLYDVLDYKRDWNKANPKNTVDLRDHIDVLNSHLKRNNLSSKKIHQLVSDPKYMLEDRYSGNTIPPNAVLKNDKIKPEHLYKYLASHPSHIDEIVSHDKSDSRLEDLIFDNPQHLKNVSNSNIEHYLHKHTVRKEGQEPRLDISGKRAKTIVEHAHDKLYDDALFKTLNSMDPEDKKAFVDRKLGITGGKPAGLASWRTNDEQTNRESEGWNDWTNGEEYDPKFAQRIAKSPHLSDDQAEHIKRHGDFNVKYNLYHNKQVDPKHGVEMFKMWHDNDENKGYSSEQLQDAYKEKKDDVYTIDDIDQDLINEDDLLDNVDETTRESYDFSNWVDDNEDDLLKEVELDEDDEDKIREKLHEDHDWTGDNSSHDAVLHGLHQKLVDHMDNEGLDSIHIDEAEGHLGVSRKEWQGNTIGHSDGTIDKDSLEEYMKDNNPKEIDYANSDDHTIDEHPEYDERYTEIADAHKLKKLRNDPYHLYDDNYEDYQSSDKYQEAWQENMKEAKEEAAKEHYGELYASSHQDDRFVPEHLHQHIPNFEELKRNRKKAIGEPTDFLDKHIPKRSYEHPYGDEQHLHEFVKDHADANGGSVDIGRMHKLMPNQGEVWKKIFGSKGKITSDEIQSKIDGLNKTPYAISYGKWDGNKMQNVNNRDQVIFRLDHTDESLKPLQEDPELFRTFQKVQEVSKRSGHPTKDNTIAWARVDTTDPDHWMIDEVQSDFGKTVTQYLKDNNEEGKADHVQKISEYHKNWREALINRVLNEAKKHGASKVSTHSPESKASHTGAEKAHSVYQDSYKKVPRKMGFKPSPAQTLPVTEKTREGVFNKQANEPSKEDLGESHKSAWEGHKEYENLYNNMAENYHKIANTIPLDGNPGQWSRKFKEMAQYHGAAAEQHQNRAKQYGIPHNDVSVFPITPFEGHEKYQLENGIKKISENDPWTHIADKKLAQPVETFDKPKDYHEGHTYHLKPSMIKTMLDMAEDLVKFELIWNGTTNKDIRDRAKYNIDLIKHLFGYEADLSKWQNRRRLFVDDIKKAVKSPSKHIGLNRLKQIKQDHSMGAGGQEYSEEEIGQAINERSSAHADKMVRNAAKQEREMAQRAQDEAAGIGGADPAHFFPAKKPVKHNENIRNIANSYAATRGFKLNHNIPNEPVNTERASKIAQAYHGAQHSPNHPDVQRAYGALIKETSDQFKHILGTGLKISKMKPGQDNPYKSSKDLFHDIKNNNHMWYYPTEQGYGSGENVSDHPLLQPTEHMHEGKPMVANDVFRIVHDYFGHAKEGNGFGPQGEEHAWKHHMQMYGPDAQRALTAETRGQNSWVNFGPHGEKNRANPANTIYADQKATILPDWAHEHGQTVKKSEFFQINISIQDEENDLDKSEFYSPTKEGEKHPTKPYVAKAHPEGQMMWHHDDATAQKNDSIINDPKQRQRLLQRMPTATHKAGMEAIMNMVAKDPNRHFIPSRDGGREKMRARHIKSLMLSPESAKIDLDANNKLSISLPRHGFSGGFTTWNYNLTPKKVVKNEKDGLEKSEQGRDFEINERIQLRGNLRKYRRSVGSVEKTQHRDNRSDSTDRNGGNISGKHLQKLQLLMKGAARRLFPFNPDQSISADEESTISHWQHGELGEEDLTENHRHAIPKMQGAARIRALNKIANRTQTRPSAKGDGKREFLLHRGMSPEERQGVMSESGKHVMYGSNSSWTPSYDTANSFSRTYTHNDHDQMTRKPVSAWIHEDKIHSIPKQYGKVLMNPLGDEVGKVRGKNQYADEFEVVVGAHHSELHNESGKKNFSVRTNPSSLDEAISDRKGLDSYYVKQQIQSHRMKKTEDLKKGAMKKLAPFKPTYGNEEHEAIEEWTGFGDGDSSARDQIPAMPQNAKIRALHKLGKHTEVRRHPKTGERMFLLHRGMSGDEYANSHSYSDHRLNHSVYDKGTKTSWTPHVDAALGFAKDHKQTSMDHKGKVVSAWIPESEIHSVPNQVLVPDINNQFRNEHEIIVNHMTPHPHANKKLVERKRFPHRHLDTKINMKGHAEKERKNTEPPEKILHDQVAREDRAMKYREKRGIGKKESDMETLSKADLASKMRTGLATMAIAGATGLSGVGPVDIKQETAVAPIEQQVKKISAKPAAKPNPEKERILSSIMDVESSNNKDRHHDRTPQNSMHRGDRAYGAYGLMPITIRETIKKHPDLMQKHGKAVPLQGSDLHNYMDKHPELEKEVASRHYDRLARVFGHSPAKISYAWLNGITGTKNDLKEKKDIDSHWHVEKIKNAYEKRKKQPVK